MDIDEKNENAVIDETSATAVQKPARMTKAAQKNKISGDTQKHGYDNKEDSKDETKTTAAKVATFTKKQIIYAKGNKDKRDLLHALLDDTTQYTKAQVEKLVNDYLKKPTNRQKSRHNTEGTVN